MEHAVKFTAMHKLIAHNTGVLITVDIAIFRSLERQW